MTMTLSSHVETKMDTYTPKYTRLQNFRHMSKKSDIIDRQEFADIGKLSPKREYRLKSTQSQPASNYKLVGKVPPVLLSIT